MKNIIRAIIAVILSIGIIIAIKYEVDNEKYNTTEITVASNTETAKELDAQIDDIKTYTNSIIKTESVSDLSAFDGDISDCYCNDIYRGGNHYYIEEGILYGTGNSSEYGQLGEISSEVEHRSIPIKLAENVVHVDYSGEYFLIYITGDHNLYAIGADVAGIFSHEDSDYSNYNAYTKPILLMKNIVYAKCGYTTIMTLDEYGNVYLIGNPDAINGDVTYIEPRFIDDEVKYITAYSSSFAYIKNDNSLWTYGSNKYGECGVGFDFKYVSTPTKIADGVECAWMGYVGFSHSESDIDDENYLIVKKGDGSFWGCGKSIGNTKIQVDFDGIIDEVVATDLLEQVYIKDYSENDIFNLTKESTFNDVENVLKQNGYEYNFYYNDDGTMANQIYTTDMIWNFKFDDDGCLREIGNSRSDSYGKNVIEYGESIEEIENTYGSDYEIQKSEYYCTIKYELENFTLEITSYDGMYADDFNFILK